MLIGQAALELVRRGELGPAREGGVLVAMALPGLTLGPSVFRQCPLRLAAAENVKEDLGVQLPTGWRASRP